MLILYNQQNYILQKSFYDIYFIVEQSSQQNILQMMSRVGQIFDKWINQSTSPIVAKLKSLINNPQNMEQNIINLALLSQQDKKLVKDIPYPLRDCFGDKFQAQAKKLTVLKSDSPDFIKALTWVCKMTGKNIEELSFLIQKVENPHIFIQFIDELIKSGRLSPTRSTPITKKILCELQKQVESLQNGDNPEINRIQSIRIKKFESNIIEFELKLCGLFSKVYSKVNLFRQQLPEIEINCQKFIRYIIQTKKPEMLGDLFVLHPQEIKDIIKSVLLSEIKSVQGNMVLELSACRLNPELVNRSIFPFLEKSSLKSDVLSELYWQKSNIYSTSDCLYIKYLPADFKTVSCFKGPQGGLFQQTNNSENSDNQRKKTMDTRIEYLNQIIMAAALKKPIYLCQTSNSFSLITDNERKSLIKFAYNLLQDCGIQAQEYNIKNVYANKVRTPLFIQYSTLLMEKIIDWGDETAAIFIKLARILKYIIFQGTNDINILNNGRFLSIFAKLINKQFDNQQFKRAAEGPIHLVSCYLQKFIEFGIDQNLLPLNKFHKLKFQQYISGMQQIYYHPNNFKDVFKDYLDSFPECYQIFGKEVKNILSEMKQYIKDKDNYFYINNSDEQEQKKATKISRILNLLDKYDIIIDEETSQIFHAFLQECGYYIAQLRIKVPKTLLKKFGIECKAEISKRFNNYLNLLQMDCFSEVPAEDYLQIAQPASQFLKQFAKAAGILKLYLLSFDLKPQVIGNISNLLQIYFKSEDINMYLYESQVKFIFERSKEVLNQYLESYKVHNNPFKRQKLVVRSLRDLYIDSICEKIGKIISNLAAKQKISLIDKFSHYIERIANFQNSWCEFNYTIHIARVMSYLTTKINLGFCNMQINKDVIFKVLKHLTDKYGKNTQKPQKGILIGSDICRFTIKMREQNKDPATEFTRISDSHYNVAVNTLFIQNFFGFANQTNDSNRRSIIIDNKAYRGPNSWKRAREIGVSFMVEQIINFMRKNTSNIKLGIKLASKVLEQPKRSPQDNDQESQWQEPVVDQNDYEDAIEIPEGYSYEPILKDDGNSSIDRQMSKLSQSIFNIRYQEKAQNLIRLYKSITKEIKNAEISKQSCVQVFTQLFRDIELNLQSQQIDQEKLQQTLQWVKHISGLISKMQVSLLHLLNEKFVNLFVNFVKKSFERENTNKKVLLYSLYILQKMIPNKFLSESKEFVQYLDSLLKVFVRIVQINADKQIDSNIIESVALKLINNDYSCDRIIQVFISSAISEGKYGKVINVIHKLVQKEKINKIEMEAHLKAHFLKIEEDIISQEAPFLTTKLKDFVDSFKIRYKDNIEQFKNVAQVFIRKIQQKSMSEDSTTNISFIFDRKHKLWFSQFGSIPISDYKSSHLVTFAVRRLTQKIEASKVDEKSIKQQLLPGQSQKSENQENLFQSFRQLFYSHPLLLPQLLRQNFSEGQVFRSFETFMLQQIQKQKKNENLLQLINFIVFLSLDHSCIIKLKAKIVFWSQILMFKFIKKISQSILSKNVLIFILHMIQLKKFNHICTLRIDQKTNSLKQLLQNQLVYVNNLPDTDPDKPNNQILCEILFYIYKYEEIHLLRNSYVPLSNKEEEGNILNQCLIPFKAIFFDEDGTIAIKRNQVIQSLNKDLEILQWSKDNTSLEDLYREVPINSQKESFKNAQKIENSTTEYIPILASQEYLSQLSSKAQNESAFPKVIQYLMFTNNNKIFKKRISRLISSIDRAQVNELGLHLPFGMNQADVMENRQQLGLNGNINRRRGYHTSVYAPQQFRSSQGMIRNEKTTQEIIESLKLIPQQEKEDDQEIMNLHRSYSRNIAQTKDRAIQRQHEEISNLINQINQFRSYITDEEELNLQQISQIKVFTEKKEFLTKLLAEDEFRYRYEYLQEDIYDIIDDLKTKDCLKYLQKFSAHIEPFLMRQQTLKLYKRFSTESIDSDISRKTNEIIDNLIIKQSKKGFSRRSSLSSQSEQIFNEIEEIEELNQRGFSSMTVNELCFPQVSQNLTLEIISMLYQSCNMHFSQLTIIPLLENKRIQEKVINTLIYILRNPISNSMFPKEVKVWDKQQRKWNPQTKADSKSILSKKILKMFDWVRHFCFYRNPDFLKTQISCEGLCGLILEPRQEFQGYFPLNYHEPYIEVIDFSLSYNHYLAASLLMSVNTLPQFLMKKIINVIKDPQSPMNSRNRRKGRHGRNHGDGIFGNAPQPTICEVLFNSLTDISKNQDFRRLFFSQFPLDKKYPRFDVLSELLQTGIYSKQHLKNYHLQTLQRCKVENKCTREQYIFLNKVFKIYSDEDLHLATQLKQYHVIHSKVLNQLNMRQLKIQKQPISKLVKHPQLLDFKVKQNFFYNSVNPIINNQFMIYERNDNTIKAERAIGIFYSAFKQLRNKPDQFWKQHLTVEFYDEENKLQRNGGPGISRQWYTTVTKQMILLDQGLFELTPGNVYFFSKNCVANTLSLQYFEFIGKLVGLSLISPTYYITPSLSILVYKLLLDEKIEFNDISQHYKDTEFTDIKNYLQNMKSYNDSSYFQGYTYVWERKKLISAQQFHNNHYLETEERAIQNFQENEPENPGQYINRKQYYVKQYIQLKPNGANIPLTLQNVHEYVELRKQQYVKSTVEGLENVIEAFKSGVRYIVKLDKLKIFNSTQLRKVVEGAYEIDIQEFKRDVIFSGSSQQPIKQWFLECFQELSPKDRSTLVQYWYASPKLHPDGIAATELKVSIDEDRKASALPTAGTCGHSLILATYPTKEVLVERVRKVISLFASGQIRQFD